MKYEIKSKRNKTIDVKAVDYNKGIHGYIRMGGKNGQTLVKGICATFFIDKNIQYLKNQDETTLYFDKENLFFYGHFKDLEKNYNSTRCYGRTVPAKISSSLYQYNDKHFSPKTSKCDINTNGKYGFMKIPLEKLVLGTIQQEIIRRVTKQTEQELPDLIKSLIKEHIDINNPNNMKTFGTVFSRFPLELKEKALENLAYYRTTQHEYKETIENLIVPNIKIVSGGLPSLGKRK